MARQPAKITLSPSRDIAIERALVQVVERSLGATALLFGGRRVFDLDDVFFFDKLLRR